MTDVIYIGKTGTEVWEKKELKTLYVMKPEEFLLMFRNISEETIGGLKQHLLQEKVKGEMLQNPTISHKGIEIEDADSFDQHHGEVLILDNGVHPDHGGVFHSCINCKGKNGKMMGSKRKSKFKQNHKPEKGCQLYQQNLFEGKSTWGDPTLYDKYPSPMGHPENNKYRRLGKNIMEKLGIVSTTVKATKGRKRTRKSAKSEEFVESSDEESESKQKKSESDTDSESSED